MKMVFNKEEVESTLRAHVENLGVDIDNISEVSFGLSDYETNLISASVQIKTDDNSGHPYR